MILTCVLIVPLNMASSSEQAVNKKQSDEGYLLYGGLFASQACHVDIERQTLPPDEGHNAMHTAKKLTDSPRQQFIKDCATAKSLELFWQEDWSHFLQIILSWLNFLARICREGSMMPPLSLSTRCRVDSADRPECES